MKLENKCALVTGGGAGIGETYAHALAGEGAAIVIGDMVESAAARVAQDIIGNGGKALGSAVDVTDAGAVARVVEEATAAFGGIDILVNNAGCHLSRFAMPPTELGSEDWRRMLDVNVVAPVMVAAACRRSMRERGGGVIVNQSSTAAYSVGSAYGVSKLALNGVTCAMAAELAVDGIRVNGIAPGLVDSPAALADFRDVRPGRMERIVAQQLIPRPGRMADLVGALLFLCTDASSFVTGETVIVGGGIVRRL